MLKNHPNTEPLENAEENTPDTLPNSQDFESDTQRLVRLHLTDKDHVITDEEIASIRIGMTPLPATENGEVIEEENTDPS